jgi:hypothetical protein
MHNICYILTFDAYLLHVSVIVHHHQGEQLRHMLEKQTAIYIVIYELNSVACMS